ncbi:MAG: antitoxin VapB family protein [Candidatus Brockarchaeota archaeon]|nr:antitoxin VapB family protein [Candidatus Brockarchaeota archaeon]MBO3809475.1 antitoxin VapB family protein [Candidatus Brockarchaeota archaeon]MBO3841633.1 antitoxin VapB family protein [Candidatus Brockarchaeota archaeon]
MMVKTITIREEVYRRLLAVKREGESFSELLERLIEEANPIDVLVKLRGCVEIKDKERLLAEIYSLRAERRT